MSDGPQLNQTLPMLSEGNIVTVGAKLFTLKGGNSFVTSLLAHLWLMLGLGGAAIVLGIVAIITFIATNSDPMIAAYAAAFSTIVLLPLIAFIWARFLASGGLLSRFSFNQLIHRKELQDVSKGYVYPRVWSYLGAYLWNSLAMLLVYLAIVSVFYGLGYVFVTAFDERQVLETLQGLIVNSGQGVLIVLGLLILATLVVAAISLTVYYFFARLWFFDTILALENQVGPLESVMRSWQLTRDQGRSVMTVLFIASVVTIPPSLIAGILNNFVPFVSLLLGVAVFPFMQSLKAVHYYELRQRNEGMTFDLNMIPAQPRQYLQRVALQTPESIELDFALGGIGSRSFAWMIDQTLLFSGIALFWLVVGAIYVYGVVPGLEAAILDTVNLWLRAIVGLLTFAVMNGYYIGFETFWRGQTPGKRWAKIRVIQDNGQPVGLKESAIRSLLGLIDINFFFIGVALIAFGKSEKRLGDFAAGTLVIQDEQRQGGRQPTVQLRFGERSQTTAQTLAQEAMIKRLTADQYLILRDFLGYRTQLELPIRKQVTVNLANQLRQIIAPPESPAALNVLDEELIEATYLACKETIYKHT